MSVDWTTRLHFMHELRCIVPLCNMECAVHVWDVKNFPLDSSESEEASRKRGLGMEFHLSTIPWDKPDTGNCSVHGLTFRTED